MTDREKSGHYILTQQGAQAEHIGFSDIQSVLVWQQEVEQMMAEPPLTAGRGSDF